MNFSYSSTYQNINTISEGNYSKDTNLQKSVMKLIGVYLKEKNKSKNRVTQISVFKSTSNINNNIIKREKKINKIKTLNHNKIINNKNNNNELLNNENKKENEEKDVWAYLNEDEEDNHKFQFNLNSSKSKISSLNEDKVVVSKTPKNLKIRKNTDFPDSRKNKSRFKKNSLKMFYENNFQGEANPKSKKKGKKKSLKSRKGEVIKLKKCTTIIQPQQKKDLFGGLSKSNKLNIYESNSKGENTILSSLDLTINDNLEQEKYIKKLHKTYKTCKNKYEEEARSDSRIDDASSSGLKK